MVNHNDDNDNRKFPNIMLHQKRKKQNCQQMVVSIYKDIYR